MRGTRSVLALGLLLLVSGQASAQEGTVSEDAVARARQLFEEGVAAGRAGRQERAADAFGESFVLFPHPGTLLNLGLYQLRAGRRVEAYRSLHRLLDDFGGVVSAAARAEVDERLTELEASLATLEVTTRPLGAVLLVDDVELGPTPLEGPIVREPGPCALEARLTGYLPAEAAIELRAGENPPVDLLLAPRPLAPRRSLLVVASRTDGATLSIGGEPPRPLPLRRWLDPGPQELVVSAAGHATQSRLVDVPEDEEVRLVIDLVPLEASGVASGGADPAGDPLPHWRRPWPWLVLGGAIVLGVGASLLAVLLGGEQEPEPDWVMRFR